MTKSLPTFDLYQAGQSPWLDNISRTLLKSGALKGLIQEQGLKGVTSNPSIFQKAISKKGGGYETQIRKLLGQGKKTLEIYDALTIQDIRETCDLFLPVYRETKGEHGFVSLEVLPNLAHDVQMTLQEARRLYKAVNKPNVLIKIPATPAGITAIQTLLGEGVNINITLMFSLKHYRDVAHAYVAGLEAYNKKGGDLSTVHSVSSVFVSRIDSFVDKELDGLIEESSDMEKKAYLENLKGKAAVANSKQIYQEFKSIFSSEKFEKLKRKGAHTQKVLWGSTSVKNPDYPDLLYVDTLVGPDTVNTMPQVTLDALLDHGEIEPETVEENVPEANAVVKDLKSLGVDLLSVGETLQDQGVDAFVEAFDVLMKTLEDHYENKQKKVALTKVRYTHLPADIKKEGLGRLASMQSENFLNRFLNQDPALWKEDGAHQKVIANRLGWLRAHEWIHGKLYELDLLRMEIQKEKIRDIVLLGMGGSSLAPEVLSLICDRKGSKTRFTIVDTTDPASILGLGKKINLKATLFIVASKSGGTVETLSQYYYFYDCVSKAYGKNAGAEQIGRHFVAITDCGSGLEMLATEKAFRKTFVNPGDIGGRFSAISFFGLVPAALMGVDVRELLRYARTFFNSMASTTNLQRNTAVALGVFLALLAQGGRDKVAFYTSKKLAPFSCWLEQLIAESIGKEGEGIIPIEGETPSKLASYGNDRVFITIKLKGEAGGELSKAAAALKRAGHPVIEMEWPSSQSIGEAFLFWEVVTAVAGVVIGINPFDEPNVTESKEITKKILKKFEQSGSLAKPKGVLKNKKDISQFFSKLPDKGYVALLAYVERTPEIQKAFNRVRKAIQSELKMPVLVGFGPRYLHSIGQLYKGGPRTGVFLEFLKQEGRDVKVPGKKYGFGQLKMAQALGDYEALASKGIPVATIDLGKNVIQGIAKFEKAFKTAK